jgi:hypothetical protein
MATAYTNDQVAASWDLWREYIDPDATMTHAEFDAATVAEKVGLIVRIFGPEVPTVEQVLTDHHLFDSIAWWDVEGGRISIDKDDLHVALEDAYDPSMPDWPAMVQLDA